MNEVILLIDDDTDFVEYMQMCLEGFGYRVVTAPDGATGLGLVEDIRPDVITLDIAMAGLDGWETCRQLKAVCDAPVIILSGRGRVNDVVRGLEIGADDYLTKPFHTKELLARVKALLRRRRVRNGFGHDSRYEVRDLVIDTDRRVATLHGRRISLTPTEFRLLACLASNAGRVLPHSYLLLEVWGSEYIDRTDFLKIYVRYLRQKIEEDPARPNYIHTQWGVGYLMPD